MNGAAAAELETNSLCTYHFLNAGTYNMHLMLPEAVKQWNDDGIYQRDGSNNNFVPSSSERPLNLLKGSSLGLWHPDAHKH